MIPTDDSSAPNKRMLEEVIIVEVGIERAVAVHASVQPRR
jgi:hypothetical protein